MTSQIEVHGFLRKILLDIWDPIGIGANPNLADEYDGYLSRLVDLAELPSGVDAVELELKRIEDTLGMPCDPRLRRRASEEVVKTVRDSAV
jgi:hypothetical protein